MRDHETVVGVQLEDRTQIHESRVFSDAGARSNSIDLLPADMRNCEWAREILSFAPSVCHVGLYLGLQGDIRANGASASNHWFHETWDGDSGVWDDPIAQQSAPGPSVSFPSLKDPAHDPGDKQRHTAEIVAMTNWNAFARWRDSTRRNRPGGRHGLQECHRVHPAGPVRAVFSGACADGRHPRIVHAADHPFVHRLPAGGDLWARSKPASIPLREPAGQNPGPRFVPHWARRRHSRRDRGDNGGAFWPRPRSSRVSIRICASAPPRFFCDTSAYTTALQRRIR